MGQEQSQEQTTNDSTVKQKGKAKIDDIIVVAEKQNASSNVDIDESIAVLHEIPITFPLGRKYNDTDGVGNVPLPCVNPNPFTEMLLRYQYHLTQSSEAVALEQNAICKRMKDIELFSLSVVKESTARKRSMDMMLMNLKKLPEMANSIDRCQHNLDRVASLLKTLNTMLPKEDRLTELML